MRLNWIAAAIVAAMSTAVPALAGGEWPDGPNKLWFESLQRPAENARRIRLRCGVSLRKERRSMLPTQNASRGTGGENATVLGQMVWSAVACEDAQAFSRTAA
jgi:hypothetical protein